MRRHHCIRSIDLWIVEGWFVDAAFEIVGHHQAWAALEKLEHPHMRSDPVRQCLGPGHLGVAVARRTQHRDKDLGLTYFAGRGIDDGEFLARVINKQLVACDMVLKTYRRY